MKIHVMSDHNDHKQVNGSSPKYGDPVMVTHSKPYRLSKKCLTHGFLLLPDQGWFAAQES